MERKEILMVVLIGALLLTTAVQSIQLIGFSNAQVVVPTTSSGSATLTSSSPTGSPSASVSKQASLQNIPTMVGGC
ncbi:MAG: hypothetical protein AABX08_00290 [Nanoarchaeota archaeon]